MRTRPSPWLAPACLAACLAACAGGPQVPAMPDAPPNALPNPGARPAAMLSGVFCGDAVLTKRGGRVAERMTVTSRGVAIGDGLMLDQTIRFAGGGTATRRWTVQPDGPDSYRGTLTGDERVAASGEVRARVAGDTLRIRYPVAGVPFGRMEQVLTLRPDGTIANVGAVRVLGVPVRRLAETITPRPGTPQPGMDLSEGSPCSAPERRPEPMDAAP